MGSPDVKESCYICDRPTDDNDFCPGCHEWICKECDLERPELEHDPNTHRSWAGD